MKPHSNSTVQARERELQASPAVRTNPKVPLQAVILTGGFDKPYAFGLTTALAASGIRLHVVGSDDVDCPEMHTTPGITFFNIQKTSQPGWSVWKKLWSVLSCYAHLLAFVFSCRIRVVHILWNGKLAYFDRTLLLLLLRAVGKRVAFTAHNVNAKKRDGGDSWLNRWTLRMQYWLVDSIFVHTEVMARELNQEFEVPPEKITVIPFGINNSIPIRKLRSQDCKRELGLQPDERVILFFGGIRPYKGLDYLIEALELIHRESADPYRLIIAGAPHKEDAVYWTRLSERISQSVVRQSVIKRIEYISDEETERYFMAADLLALPYTHVYQSGVLFLGYSFGLPVVASKAGSFEEEIVEGETGFVAETADSRDLARAIMQYFDGDLYRNLVARRSSIQEFARHRYSWDLVAERTLSVYMEIIR